MDEHPASTSDLAFAPELLRVQAEVEGLRAALRDETARRQRAEDELRQKSSLLAATLKAYPDLHFRLAPDGTFLEYSADDLSLLYRRPEEFLGRRVQDIVPPDISRQFDDLCATVRRTGQVAGMEYALDMPGGERFYEARLLPSLDDGNFLLFVRDITPRRRALDALRASEARFRLMVDQSPVGLQIIRPDGVTVRVNSAWEQLWGVTLDQLTDYNILHDPQLEQKGILAQLRRAFAGQPVDLRATLYVPDRGRYAHRDRWVHTLAYPVKNDRGAVVEVILVQEDITDRKRAEAELRAVASYTRCILLHGEIERTHPWPDELRLDTRVCNWKLSIQDEQAAQRIVPLDVRPDQTYVQAWVDARHPDDWLPCRARAIDALRRGLPSYRQEFRCIDKHGRTVWVQEDVTIHPIGEDRWEAFGVCTDITDRKTAEEALRQSEQHFREAAEFNNLLLREVDHRVKNNLAGLLSLLSLVQHKATDVDAFAAAMESRLRGMSHVHHLLASTGWKSVDLRAMLSSLLAALDPMARHRAQVVVDGPDVQIQPRHALPLTMIVVEFFTNSCKYGAHSTPTGTVTITWNVGPTETRHEATKAQSHEAPPPSPSRLRASVPQCPPTLELRWTESGGPPIPQPVTPSLGSELVQNFVQRELHGAVRLQFPPSGVNHLLHLPLQ